MEHFTDLKVAVEDSQKLLFTQPITDKDGTYDITVNGEELLWCRVDETHQQAWSANQHVRYTYYPELNVIHVRYNSRFSADTPYESPLDKTEYAHRLHAFRSTAVGAHSDYYPVAFNEDGEANVNILPPDNTVKAKLDLEGHEVALAYKELAAL